jgi:hypothetical protein
LLYKKIQKLLHEKKSHKAQKENKP